MGDPLYIQRYKKVEGKKMEKDHVNSNHKKARVAVLILDRIGFKTFYNDKRANPS